MQKTVFKFKVGGQRYAIDMYNVDAVVRTNVGRIEVKFSGGVVSINNTYGDSNDVDIVYNTLVDKMISAKNEVV